MRETFQKPLGWLQRFFFNVERGDFPFPSPVLDIRFDWPLEYKPIQIQLTSIVGVAEVDIYAPDAEHHGLVTHLVTSVSTVFLTTDVIRLFLIPPTVVAAGIPITLSTGIPATEYPLIRSKIDVSASNGGHYNSIDSVYVPPRWILRGSMQSTAAGLVQTFSGSVWDRLKSYPLSTP